jgi:TP901 family phage tail tape measure protein
LSGDRNLRIQLLFQAMDKVTRPLRDIAGGSSRAADNLKAMRDRMRELDRAQADIGGFREAKAGARALEERLQSAQARATQLGRQMATAQTPTKKLATEFAHAKREAAGLEAEHGREVVKLQQLRDRLNAAGISTNKLAEHERELRREASRTNGELAEQARRLEKVQERSTRLAAGREAFGRVQGTATGLAAGGMAAIETGRKVGGPILAAEGEGRAFQSVMTDIALKANLSREAARKMGVELIAIGRSANQLPESIQQGFDTLLGKGLDPKRAMKAIAPIGRAATAYGADVRDLSDATFASLDNLKVPAEQVAKVLDVMGTAGNAGGFEINDMAAHFPALTAAAQALGQTGVEAVGDLSAALQIALKGAGDPAQAANNVQNLLNKINTEDTIKNFKEFGINLPKAMKAAAAAGKSPIEAIAELTNKATKGDLSKLSFLFGDAQVQAALRPLIQGFAEYKRIRAEAMGATGVVDAAFAKRMEDSEQKAQRLRVQMSALKLVMADQLRPTFDAMRDRAAAFAGWIAAWAGQHPNLAKGILLTAVALSGLLIVLGGAAIALAGVLAPLAALAFTARMLGTTTPGLFVKFAKGLLYPLKIFPLFRAGIMMLARGVAQAAAMMLANPLVAAIVAIVVVLAFAGYMIWKHWDTIKAAFFAGIARIGQAWAAFKASLAAGWAAAIATFKAFIAPLAAAWAWIRSLFANGGAGAWQAVKNAFAAGFAWFVGLHVKFVQFGANLIQGLIGGITGKLGQLKSTIVNAASSAAKWFKQKLGIHSPSRVFMGLGGFVMDGLDRGLANGAPAPIQRLTRLSRDMTAALAIGAAAPAMAGVSLAGGPGPGAGAAAGAAAGGAPLIGTLVVKAGPGMDERMLADLVAKKVAEALGKRGGSGSGSFGDAPDGEWV